MQSQRTCVVCGEPVDGAKVSLSTLGQWPDGTRIPWVIDYIHTDGECWTRFAAALDDLIDALRDPQLALLESIPVATAQKIGALRRKHRRA